MIALALGVGLAIRAAPAGSQPWDDRHACEAAIEAQQPGSGLPPGLLLAIAQVESGRWDPGLRRPAPWPWAINAEGSGQLASSREDAVGRVRRLLARGVQSVDVGCMQINLRHHPQAFASLEEAFDPQRNVAHAIRFLRELHQRHGDWSAAVMRYHSGSPQRGEAYARRVNLAWGAQPSAPRPSLAASPGPAPVRDRVAVLLSPEAMLVQVIRPTRDPAANRPVIISMPRER
jgi:soluble lytic murein transglycosylase-like protein